MKHEKEELFSLEKIWENGKFTKRSLFRIFLELRKSKNGEEEEEEESFYPPDLSLFPEVVVLSDSLEDVEESCWRWEEISEIRVNRFGGNNSNNRIRSSTKERNSTRKSDLCQRNFARETRGKEVTSTTLYFTVNSTYVLRHVHCWRKLNRTRLDRFLSFDFYRFHPQCLADD